MSDSVNNPKISIVIPVYNEEESLDALFAELYPVMAALGRTFEIVFINDGSRDRSFAMLYDFEEAHPEVRVVDLNGNFGQHMAIMAGFEAARGDYIITLDADLQNPPSSIPDIVGKMDAGHDVVGTYRLGRRDPLFRKAASKIVNVITRRIAKLDIKDYGCMMRGYSRRIIDIINAGQETATFIPALGRKFAVNPVELPIPHRERERGESKYGISQLIRLNFDLMTSFSLVPLQMVTMAGMAVSLFSFLLVCYMLLRRLIIGPEVEGMFTLMAIQFLLTGITLMSLGITGEYVGRIYNEVSKRPRYVIKKIYEHCGASERSGARDEHHAD
ncbi:UDP-4-amino-4-deoxy-L-arabinose-oxoglutarate aminotransferase [Synergistales bacterium]|nr:UDP-4-amino-4-deoxy-L-arabinose-oxoglutarate aminotransferase [Synergistales bacterium]